jgi:hypothetical protein
MERWKPELRDREYGLKLAHLRHRLAETPGRPLLLVLGSSRAAVGLRPGVLPSYRTPDGREALVFNFSAIGSGPVGELLWLRRLLSDGIHPDWVVAEFWPPFWDQEGLCNEDAFLNVGRMSWTDLPLVRRYWRTDQAPYRQWWVDRLVPCVTHRLPFSQRLLPSWLPFDLYAVAALDRERWVTTDRFGWGTYLQVSQDLGLKPSLKDLVLARQTLQYVLEGFHFSTASENAMRELLALCRERGIGVALLYMPEHSEFQRLMPAAVRREVDQHLNGLCSAWAVSLVDARRWVGDDGFAEFVHLLPAGAEEFTRRFGKETLPSLFEQPPVRP